MKILYTIIIATGLAGASVLTQGVSEANAARAKCGDREKIIKVLKDDYNEVPIAIGLSQKSTEAFEIFTSEKGTWTVMMTMSTGQTCIMATGHSWQDLPKEILGTKISF